MPDRMSRNSHFSADRLPLVLGAMLLAGVTVFAYFPAMQGGFIWDDELLITRNDVVKAPDRLRRHDHCGTRFGTRALAESDKNVRRHSDLVAGLSAMQPIVRALCYCTTVAA